VRDPNRNFNNEKSGLAVTFQTYMRDVLASNPGQDISYSEVFRGFSQSVIQADIRVVPR
jgi:hypothetical protein